MYLTGSVDAETGGFFFFFLSAGESPIVITTTQWKWIQAVKTIQFVFKWLVLFCPALIQEAVWAIKWNWKMSVVKPLLFWINDNNHVSCKNDCLKRKLSHLMSWQADNTALNINQHNFQVKVCTWKIKLQAFHWRCTRTHLDTGFEPGRILVPSVPTVPFCIQPVCSF